MALKGKVDTALLSDPGRVRTNNEDAVGELEDLGLLILADGMGGYNAGEVASGISLATVQDVVARGWGKLKSGKSSGDGVHSPEALLLKEAVETAHNTIFQVAEAQPQYKGMGTTLVTCILHGDQMSIAYVGDSRLYRLRGGRLDQITRDHSLLEELIARGHYTREEANKLVRKNIVTRALGVEEGVIVDVIEEPIQQGDVILLCSDGLNDLISDRTIALTLRQFADNLHKAAEKLVEQANEAGGRDNVSVVLARVDQSLTAGRHWFGRIMEWF